MPGEDVAVAVEIRWLVLALAAPEQTQPTDKRCRYQKEREREVREYIEIEDQGEQERDILKQATLT